MSRLQMQGASCIGPVIIQHFPFYRASWSVSSWQCKRQLTKKETTDVKCFLLVGSTFSRLLQTLG